MDWSTSTMKEGGATDAAVDICTREKGYCCYCSSCDGGGSRSYVKAVPISASHWYSRAGHLMRIPSMVTC